MIKNGEIRYSECKHIGDIMNDIKMNPSDIHHQMKIQLSSKEFAKETIQNLQKYNETINKITPLYDEVTKCIMAMDHYYTEEKTNLGRIKLSMKKGTINQIKIKEKIRSIEKKSSSFEFDQVDINMSLRKIIKNFPSSQDKLEHIKKSNAFYKLFMDIYTDLDNLCVAYGQLLRNIE